MNRFIRLGNIILNLDNVIEIQFDKDANKRSYDGAPGHKRPALYITTTEMTPGDYGVQSRVIRFLDKDAEDAWEFLRSNLNEINGKIMRYLDVTPS